MIGTSRTVLAFGFLLLCFSCLPSWAAEALASETITELSLEIHGQLDGLRRQSQALTEQLLTAESELQESSLQVEALKTELAGLNSCLESTNEKLFEYSAKLTEYEAKLRNRARAIVVLSATVFLLVMIGVLTIVLKIKGMKLLK